MRGHARTSEKPPLRAGEGSYLQSRSITAEVNAVTGGNCPRVPPVGWIRAAEVAAPGAGPGRPRWCGTADVAWSDHAGPAGSGTTPWSAWPHRKALRGIPSSLAGARRQLRGLGARYRNAPVHRVADGPPRSGLRTPLRLATRRIRRRAPVHRGRRDSPYAERVRACEGRRRPSGGSSPPRRTGPRWAPVRCPRRSSPVAGPGPAGRPTCCGRRR